MHAHGARGRARPPSPSLCWRPRHDVLDRQTCGRVVSRGASGGSVGNGPVGTADWNCILPRLVALPHENVRIRHAYIPLMSGSLNRPAGPALDLEERRGWRVLVVDEQRKPVCVSSRRSLLSLALDKQVGGIFQSYCVCLPVSVFPIQRAGRELRSHRNSLIPFDYRIHILIPSRKYGYCKSHEMGMICTKA